MTASATKRRTYDPNIRKLVVEGRGDDIVGELDIPRSTVSGWKRRPLPPVVSSGTSDQSTEELQARIRVLEKRVKVLMVRFKPPDTVCFNQDGIELSRWARSVPCAHQCAPERNGVRRRRLASACFGRRSCGLFLAWTAAGRTGARAHSCWAKRPMTWPSSICA